MSSLPKLSERAVAFIPVRRSSKQNSGRAGEGGESLVVAGESVKKYLFEYGLAVLNSKL